MKNSKTFLACACGIAIGIGLVISCSDDSPSHADAATCDCPTSEPPLAGRIISVTTTGTAAGSDGVGLIGTCPDAAIPLGGGCFVANNQPHDVILRQSTVTSTGWYCEYHNNELSPVGVGITVRCLTPAP